MSIMHKNWFENWFDSPYYHILYQNRNDEEAEFFIDNICIYLKPSLESKLLDVACGRGRHSVYFNKKGYQITGIDLSPASIAFAKRFANENLHFYVHDIREVFQPNAFDIALNLFTSFGYFNSVQEHIDALKAVKESLRPGGLLVLDYLNTEKTIKHLNHREVKRLNEINFYISREFSDDSIIKHIKFEDKGQMYTFQERVKAFTYNDFENIFTLSGFNIIQVFGDYSLNSFDSSNSNRLIFICQKNDA